MRKVHVPRSDMVARVLVVGLIAATLGACAAAPGEQPASGSAGPTVAVSPASPTPGGAASAPPGMTPPPVTGTYVDIPGTDIAIVPPEGFFLTEDWAGFQGPIPGASIQVAQLPGPYAEASKVMNAQGLASQGMTLTSRTEVILIDRDGLLIEATQQAGGVGFRKILYMFGDAALTTLIVGTIPDANADLLDALTVAVLSAGPRLISSDDPLEGLPYEITPTPPLRFAGRISNTVTFNVSGTIPSGKPGEPAFIVAPSLGMVAIDDREAAFRDRLAQLQLSDLDSEPPAEVSIGGLPGLASVGTGTDSIDGVVEVYAVMLFHDDEYVFMLGRAGWLVADEIVPAFRSTAESFALKP